VTTAATTSCSPPTHPWPGADVATVVEVKAADCLDLRMRVLRTGTPSDDPTLPGDHAAATFHLGVLDDAGLPIGVVSFMPRPFEGRPRAVAMQLRGMAVEPTMQGTGVGRQLWDAAVHRLRAEHVQLVWAEARDSALGFYERLGMTVAGDGYVTPSTGLPHHTVLLEL
jgi:ribosomal protein S18 acetylase RimI-like enzyme